jgi:hypothetical protein
MRLICKEFEQVCKVIFLAKKNDTKIMWNLAISDKGFELLHSKVESYE